MQLTRGKRQEPERLRHSTNRTLQSQHYKSTKGLSDRVDDCGCSCFTSGETARWSGGVLDNKVVDGG
jgi:hypothetical protein